MNHQVLITSYKKDFPWLDVCLTSYVRFSDGFSAPPVVAVDAADYDEAVKRFSDRAQVKRWDGPGFGRAQEAMMSGDILCPNADWVYLWGSDFMAHRFFTPMDYWHNPATPTMYYQTWPVLLQTNPETVFWKAGVENALGNSDGEFMRLPSCLVYPQALYQVTRARVETHTRQNFRDYVWHNVNHVRNFSESNILGQVAWEHFRHKYNWVNLDQGGWPENPPVIQFWSHGGFDRVHDKPDQFGAKATPRKIIKAILGIDAN